MRRRSWFIYWPTESLRDIRRDVGAANSLNRSVDQYRCYSGSAVVAGASGRHLLATPQQTSMQLLGIVGPETETTALTEQLARRLADRGRVATVGAAAAPELEAATDAGRYRSAGASAAYGVTDDGSWTGVGTDRTLDDLLADLAPEYDYALVAGADDAAIPTVAIDGQEGAGETVVSAPSAEEVDADELIEILDAQEPFETLDSLVAEIERSPDAEYAGAIATFTGRVRTKEDPDDDPTEFLEFEKYDGVAEARMAEISDELRARDGVQEVLMHHRTGVVEAGEDIVFVVVLAGHRDEAFTTVSDGIDRLKAEVPLFKKEVTVDGAFWAHQHDEAHRVGDDPIDGSPGAGDGGRHESRPEPTPEGE
jgi:molybdopterin synthase catalytic subunit